jgi:hypothetical protein
MKTIPLIAFLLLFTAIAAPLLANCPEDPNDNGICDTLNVEVYPGDQFIKPSESLHLAQFSFYVTHDYNELSDSLAAFTFPLYYLHTNDSKFCSLTSYWNNIDDFTNPRNIFRHLIINGDTVHNWMMDQYEKGEGGEWDNITLYLDGTSHMFLTMIAGGTDPRVGDASHVLIATLTIKLEDTCTTRIDTCFYPIDPRLSFTRGDAISYIPRDNMPYYESIKMGLWGDANTDGIIDIGDVVCLINYLFKNGTPPLPMWAGDNNCNDVVDASDVVYLINYLFKSGPAPSCEIIE